jgi:hypothetical protein
MHPDSWKLIARYITYVPGLRQFFLDLCAEMLSVESVYLHAEGTIVFADMGLESFQVLFTETGRFNKRKCIRKNLPC